MLFDSVCNFVWIMSLNVRTSTSINNRVHCELIMLLDARPSTPTFNIIIQTSLFATAVWEVLGKCLRSVWPRAHCRRAKEARKQQLRRPGAWQEASCSSFLHFRCCGFCRHLPSKQHQISRPGEVVARTTETVLDQHESHPLGEIVAWNSPRYEKVQRKLIFCGNSRTSVGATTFNLRCRFCGIYLDAFTTPVHTFLSKKSIGNKQENLLFLNAINVTASLVRLAPKGQSSV